MATIDKQTFSRDKNLKKQRKILELKHSTWNKNSLDQLKSRLKMAKETAVTWKMKQEKLSNRKNWKVKVWSKVNRASETCGVTLSTPRDTHSGPQKEQMERKGRKTIQRNNRRNSLKLGEEHQFTYLRNSVNPW